MRGPGVVFCGNLPSDVKEKEVDDLFYKARRHWRRGQARPAAGMPDCRILGLEPTHCRTALDARHVCWRQPPLDCRIAVVLGLPVA